MHLNVKLSFAFKLAYQHPKGGLQPINLNLHNTMYCLKWVTFVNNIQMVSGMSVMAMYDGVDW